MHGPAGDGLQTTSSTSAYAAKRGRQLVSHTGNEAKQPRYLNIIEAVGRPDYRSVEIDAMRSVGTTGPGLLSEVVAKARDTVRLAEDHDNVCASNSRNARMKNETAIECSVVGNVRNFPPAYSNNPSKILSGTGTVYRSSGDAAKAKAPPKKILKHVGQAIKEWGMIEDGDRLLLGIIILITNYHD